MKKNRSWVFSGLLIRFEHKGLWKTLLHRCKRGLAAWPCWASGSLDPESIRCGKLVTWSKCIRCGATKPISRLREVSTAGILSRTWRPTKKSFPASPARSWKFKNFSLIRKLESYVKILPGRIWFVGKQRFAWPSPSSSVERSVGAWTDPGVELDAVAFPALSAVSMMTFGP